MIKKYQTKIFNSQCFVHMFIHVVTTHVYSFFNYRYIYLTYILLNKDPCINPYFKFFIAHLICVKTDYIFGDNDT